MHAEITFTRREREILELLCLGSSVKLIAYELELSAPTVNKHRARMCVKAGVSQSELPIWGIQTPAALDRGGRCRPGMHPLDCTCDSPLCAGRRRHATS